MTQPSHPSGAGPWIRVVLADDQRLLRESLRVLLELHKDIKVVGEAEDGVKAEALVEQLRPHVVLMDLRMPRRDGVEATRRITARWPEAQVLVLTTYDDDELVFRSIEAGASGYLLKDVGSDTLAEAIRAAARGESPMQPRVARKVLRKLRAGLMASSPTAPSMPVNIALTGRELDVLKLLATGATNPEIADQLALTEGTIRNYVSNILEKTGMHDRTQAALFAVRHGFAP